MGLFGPPKKFRDRDFSMPCSRSEALDVIVASSDWEGNQPFGSAYESYSEAQNNGLPVGTPPLVQSIYFAEFGEDGFVIAAGNRTNTLWKLQLSLVGDNPVQGSLKTLERNSDQWMGNVSRMLSSLERAVRSVGGKTGRWPDIFG